MRKLVWIVVLAAVAWCGWWWMASTTMRSAITTWFEARSLEGWQADMGAIDGGGFPLTLQANMSDIALADPDAGLAIETGAVDITAPAWWPGDVTVTLDDAPILLASPLGRSELSMQDGIMALNLHPGAALELEALGWTAGPWQVTDGTDVQMQADTLTVTMTQTTGATYAFVAHADGFAPGDPARSNLRLPDTFPRTFDSLAVQATVTFDRPWDKTALDTARPQPRAIDLHLAEAHWGDLNINVSTDLQIDASGSPTGDLSLQAENWRAMLDLAERSGSLSPTLRGQAEAVLQLLAGASGNPETLDVDVTFRDGAIYFGFLPIAPAPRIILR